MEDNEQRQTDHTDSHESQKKTLVFDDFQVTPGAVPVVDKGEEPRVVPSTRMAHPVPEISGHGVLSDIDVLDFFDLDTTTAAKENDPRGEFNSILNKLLLVLKDVVLAYSTVFFWVNREKAHLVVEAMATESDCFTEEKRFPIESDLASQVALSGKPQVLGTVTPVSESDLVRYYHSPAGIRSVIAVPVFYKTPGGDIAPIGVIVADSKAEDAFGQETVAALGRFTKLLSTLIQSYNDKYELLLDAELLGTLRQMQDRIRSELSESGVLAALTDALGRLLHWDFLTVTMYAEPKNGWVVQRVVNTSGRPYVTAEHLIDPHASIIGSSITGNKVESVADLQQEKRCRFFLQESFPATGSFMAIPMSSFQRCYGALSLETETPGGFTGKDVEMAYRLVENAAAALEVLYVNDLLNEYLATDYVTGLTTKKLFLKTLDDEVRRASDFQTELACVLMAVDRLDEHVHRYGSGARDRILSDIGKIIRSSTHPYDAVGRLDKNRIGVLLINQTASEGYLWAEKIRKQIAGHIIPLDDKTLSVTIGAGVCGLVGTTMEARDILAGASQVLDKAAENGGNLVRVYL